MPPRLAVRSVRVTLKSWMPPNTPVRYTPPWPEVYRLVPVETLVILAIEKIPQVSSPQLLIEGTMPGRASHEAMLLHSTPNCAGLAFS